MPMHLWTRIKIWWSNFDLKLAIRNYFDEEYQYDKRKRLIQLSLDRLNAESDGCCTWNVIYKEPFYRYVMVRPDEFPNMPQWSIGPNISRLRIWMMIREAKHARYIRKVTDDRDWPH